MTHTCTTFVHSRTLYVHIHIYIICTLIYIYINICISDTYICIPLEMSWIWKLKSLFIEAKQKRPTSFTFHLSKLFLQTILQVGQVVLHSFTQYLFVIQEKSKKKCCSTWGGRKLSNSEKWEFVYCCCSSLRHGNSWLPSGWDRLFFSKCVFVCYLGVVVMTLMHARIGPSTGGNQMRAPGGARRRVASRRSCRVTSG